MKKLLLAAAGASALAFAAAPAQSAIFVSLDGSTVSETFVNEGIQNTWNADCSGGPGSDNCGGFDSIQVSTNPVIGSVLLHSETVEANSSGAASIDIWVTRTGITETDYNAFLTNFSGTFGFGSGLAAFSVVYASYIDPTNGTGGDGLFSDDNLLSTATLVGAGGNANPGSFSYNDSTYFAGLTGPYAVTTRYTITTAGAASLQPDAIIGGAVPEPGTWALMIAGFGGAGAMLRRRRALSVAA